MDWPFGGAMNSHLWRDHVELRSKIRVTQGHVPEAYCPLCPAGQNCAVLPVQGHMCALAGFSSVVVAHSSSR